MEYLVVQRRLFPDIVIVNLPHMYALFTYLRKKKEKSDLTSDYSTLVDIPF